MRSRFVIASALAVVTLSTGAYAQNAPATPMATAAPMIHSGEWRSSKLIGLNVYNMQNEKLGDINEILVRPSGQVAGIVIGVGGFLGMGEHDVMLALDQVKFMNEPVRTSTAPVVPTPNPTGTPITAPAPNRPVRATNEKWYPDHAVVNATKDQLKAMPQFKYAN